MLLTTRIRDHHRLDLMSYLERILRVMYAQDHYPLPLPKEFSSIPKMRETEHRWAQMKMKLRKIVLFKGLIKGLFC